MERFNFDTIVGIRDKKLIKRRVQDFVDKCSNESLPVLSDLIADKYTYGGVVMRALGTSESEKARMQMADQMLLFKIKVLKDEFGEKVLPGSYVLHKSLKPSKRLASRKERDLAIQRGEYEKEFFDVRKFKVDEKGCITCAFESAVYFLNNYGLHAITGKPLTTKIELSKNAWSSPDGSKVKHIWYWRYQEVTDEQYKELPIIRSSK